MKLKQYIKNLNEMVEANPSALEMTVVYSVDDEGNDYDTVKYAPSLMTHEGEQAICIN